MTYIYKIPKPPNSPTPDPLSPPLPFRHRRHNHPQKQNRLTLAHHNHQSSFSRLPQLIQEGHNLLNPYIDQLMLQQVEDNKSIKASLDSLSLVQKQVFIDIKRNNIEKRQIQTYHKKKRYQHQKHLIQKQRSQPYRKDHRQPSNPFTEIFTNDQNSSPAIYDNYLSIRAHESNPRMLQKSISHNKMERYWKPNNLEPIFEEAERAKEKQEELLEKVQLLNKQKQELIRRINSQVQNNSILSQKISSIKEGYEGYQQNHQSISSNNSLEHRVEHLTNKLKDIDQQNQHLRKVLLNLHSKKTLFRNKSHHNFQFGFSEKGSNNNIERRSIRKKVIDSGLEKAPWGSNMNINRKLTSESSKYRIPSIEDFDAPPKQYSSKYIECIPRNVESKYYRAESQSLVSQDRFIQ